MRKAAWGATIACTFHVSSALAAGSAWSVDGYARIVHERDVVLFDGETEQLVVQVRFQSDARAQALLVPLPSKPLAENGFGLHDDLVFARIESLVRYDDPALIPDAGETETIAQSTSRTARGALVTALGDWLQSEDLGARGPLLTWAKRTAKTIYAVKLADDDPPEPSRIVQSPALRFSFATKKAFLPYTEAPPDEADEARFVARRGRAITSHVLDVWVVAPTAVDLEPKSNLERRATTAVSSVDLEGAIGKVGTFDPKTHPTWVVTRFSEHGKGPRQAFDELSVVPAKMLVAPKKSSEKPSHTRRKVWFALGLGLLLAVAFALREQR
jgi:hypothetical protein